MFEVWNRTDRQTSYFHWNYSLQGEIRKEIKQGRCLELRNEQTDKQVIFSEHIHYREKIKGRN